jgi:hypothetical protein
MAKSFWKTKLALRPVRGTAQVWVYWLAGRGEAAILVLELEAALLVKALITLGWMRDVVLILLLCAGNHLRHTSPAIGFAIIGAALLIFAERFVWAWHLCDLRDKHAASASSAPR